MIDTIYVKTVQAFCWITLCLTACSGQYSFDRNERELYSLETTLEQIKLHEGGNSSEDLDSIFMWNYESIVNDEGADTSQVRRANELLGEYAALKIQSGFNSLSENLETLLKGLKDFSVGFNEGLQKD